MAKKIELLEHLRKLSGMPPLTEEELANLAEDEEEGNEETLEEAAYKGKKKNEDGHKDDSEEDAEDGDEEVEEDDEDDEEKKSSKKGSKPSKEELLARFGKKKAKSFKKDGGKEKDSDETDEALTATKKKANLGSGADVKVATGDPALDPEADKHAPAADAGEEEVVEADAVQKTTADGGIPKGKQKVGDKSDEKNITPEKKKGAKAAGVDLKVALGERKKNEIIPETMMVRIVKEAMDNAEGDEDQKLNEVGKVFNRMMVASFDGPQGRREELRELVNRSEVSKKMMVHETSGKSAFGEGMHLKEAAGAYESDKQDLMTETGQRLLAQFKVRSDEDESLDESYIAEQMITDRLIAAKKGK